MNTKSTWLNIISSVCFSLALLILGIATNTAVQAEDFEALDAAVPRGGNTEMYAPAFDFDTDGCLPSAGISREGTQNSGLPAFGFP